MNLYHAYMNVNYIDLMGDIKAVNALLYNLDPTRLVYINKGIMLGLLSNVKGIRDLAGEAFSVVFLNSFEDNAEKFNRAKKTYNYVMANKEQIIRDITKEVIDYSDRYLQAVFEGKDKERLWEEEGKIACEIALMFIGVGEISALAKSSKFLKSVQLLAKAKLDKVLKGVSNSNVGKIVEDFLKGSNVLYRRTHNLGDFSELKVPMQMRYVKMAAKEAGIDLKGIKITIDRSRANVNLPYFGSTSTNCKNITLFSKAFTNTKELVKTLGHERTHSFQKALYGNNPSLLRQFEKAAYEIEDTFYNFYLKNKSGKLNKFD